LPSSSFSSGGETLPNAVIDIAAAVIKANARMDVIANKWILYSIVFFDY
jgi:hypothetical protein